MKAAMYEGVVEHGCIHVAGDVSLPDKAKVFIVVPEVIEVETPRTPCIASPRLAHPEQASEFIKEVLDVKEIADADV